MDYEWPTEQEQDDSWILDVLGWRRILEIIIDEDGVWGAS